MAPADRRRSPRAPCDVPALWRRGWRQERARMRDLEREVKELRRANEILKAAASFFARELDPQPKR